MSIDVALNLLFMGPAIHSSLLFENFEFGKFKKEPPPKKNKKQNLDVLRMKLHSQTSNICQTQHQKPTPEFLVGTSSTLFLYFCLRYSSLWRFKPWSISRFVLLP